MIEELDERRETKKGTPGAGTNEPVLGLPNRAGVHLAHFLSGTLLRSWS